MGLSHFLGKKLNNPIFKNRVKQDAKNFSEDIQDLLNWYANNVKDLNDEIRSGLHMGQLMEFIIKTEKIKTPTNDLENISSEHNVQSNAILELGVFRGGTTTCFAKTLQKIKSERIIFACDTFSGFPYSDTNHEELFDINADYLKDTSYESVIKRYEKFHVDKKIIALKGKFEDTLEQKLKNTKFSFVFSDSDLYDGTKYSLNFLKNRMCEGGIIVFHNYGKRKEGVWGETDAVDEFCQENNMKINTSKSLPYIQF